MTKQEFIEKAVEGGWLPKEIRNRTDEEWFLTDDAIINSRESYRWYLVKGNIISIFIDPKSWEAIGKAEGWIDKDFPNGEMRCDNPKGICEERYCPYGGYVDPYQKMHQMIDHLISGGTITSYLETL